MNKVKRIISVLTVFVILITMIPAVSVSAEDTDDKFPYTLFAASDIEGAITINADNFCVNGNVATNGTVVSQGNMNINGTIVEHAGQEMIYIFNKIDDMYFNNDDSNKYGSDYNLEQHNINISIPVEIIGEAELTGNINISTALKALSDIVLNGEVKNTDNAIIFSKYGDIIIDSTDVNLNGLIYAPFGEVNINAQNLNLNNVVIIADKITVTAPNVNANYGSRVAAFVGNESEILYIPSEEYEYLKDSDEDGIPDLVEEESGLDPENSDTDGDGLPDGYEWFITVTDPTMTDSDENGILDGEEDNDKDGLSNIEELEIGTHPSDEDTDNDGLWDGDEVNIYYTDPLIADTDGDGLDDGDELFLGTDPLNPDTNGNGILDGEEKILQTYTHIVENTDCPIDEVIVTMESAGNIQKNTEVKSVMDNDILCSTAAGLVGEPFSIETDAQFDSAKLIFKIDETQLGETNFDNLMFLWYDEENNEFVALETEYDHENYTVSITTTHFSRYMVVDKEKWYEAWSVEFNYNPNGENITYNTVLAIDCSGSMDSVDKVSQNVARTKSCNRITAANGFIDFMGENDKAAIVLFASGAEAVTGLTNDDYELRNGLQLINDYGGTDFNSAITKSIDLFDANRIESEGETADRIILLSDGDSTISDNTLQKAKDRGIKIYTVGLGGSSGDSLLHYISNYTGGEFYKAFDSEELIDLYYEMGLSDFDTTDTDKDGLYDAVESAGVRLQNGYIIYDLDPTNPDTDFDGLDDGVEINPHIKKSYKFCLSDFKISVNKVYYFEAISDPCSADADYDGIEDKDDADPFDNTFSGIMKTRAAKEDYYNNVEFTVDYRKFFGDNETYHEKLAVLGSVFVTLAYHDASITISDGMNFEGRIDGLYKELGLADIENYNLVDLYSDDDVSEMEVGHKVYIYNGTAKEIIFVTVRGTNGTIQEWSSNFDVGADTEDYWDRNNIWWVNKENHKGFDVAANRLNKELSNYINDNVEPNADKVIFIVGHSRGAAIANILGTYYENENDYESFVYTFATPNTTTASFDKLIAYKTIFNIINKDDLVTYLPLT